MEKKKSILELKGEKIGVVIADRETPNHLRFRFQVQENYEPKSGEYVTAISPTRRIFLGQVSFPHSFNPYYADPRTVDFHLDSGKEVSLLFPTTDWTTAEAYIVGEWTGTGLDKTGSNPKPGWDVWKPAASQLASLLGIQRSGIYLGKLHGQDLNVYVDPNDLFHHGVILGKTGSGKTYTAGVIIEDCLENGLAVVAVDPHGELGLLSEPNDQLDLMKNFGVEPKLYDVTEYAPPEFVQPNQIAFTLRVGELSFSDVLSIVGLPGDMQQNLVITAIRNLRRTMGTDYNLTDLLSEVSRTGGGRFSSSTISTTSTRLRFLRELGIIGTGISPEELVREGGISLITLPGVDEQIQQIIVTILARKLLRARMRRDVPKFILYIEEGHLFAPRQESTVSKSALIEFAKSGRKFGAGLLIASQQPSDLTERIISQCHTRLFLSMDSERDLRHVAAYTGIGSSQLVDMLPDFPPGRALVKSRGLARPLLVDIRPRKSKHGGITGEVRPPPRPRMRKGLARFL